MKSTLFSQLFDAFKELEAAIQKAKELCALGERSSELIERLSTYEVILEKQKRLASSLYEQALEANWVDVHRQLKIINQLSRMIRDDAREILDGQTEAVGDLSTLPPIILQ